MTRTKLSPNQLEALRRIAGGRFHPALVREADGWYARWRPDVPWLDEYVRAAAMTPSTADAEEQSFATLHDAWLAALTSRTGRVVWEEGELARFAAELDAWTQAVAAPARCAEIAFTFEPSRTPTVSCACPKGVAGYRALGQAAAVFGPLRGLRKAAKKRLAVTLTAGETEAFLRTGARDLRAAGYAVDGAAESGEVRCSAELLAAARPAKDRTAELKLTVRVAGEVVTAEEIRRLLESRGSFVFFRDRWIEVDRAILREALRALERAGKAKVANPLAFALGLGAVGRLELASVAAHGWVRGLVNELRGSLRLAPVAAPAGFTGTLRDYQARGVAWLKFLSDHGFGALLADDMGLGKTIQAIAWMLALRAEAADRAPFLVVAPLTLLANWSHELARFAPSLRVYVHQGEFRHRASGFPRAVAAADVVLTSYTLLVREHGAFAEIAWGGLVLDEAQAVKNPDTQVARACRALRPPRRLALTGTPVENSVADIWSLEWFLNPGFLGERKDFTERFVKPLRLDPQAAAGRRLRAALEPLVLRRVKSDPAIAAELGAKREIREYCELADDQRAAYETALADYRSGPKRPGDIFALLTELKLVCDGTGKIARLVDLLEPIFAAGESALVFTQYVAVGRRLQAVLEKRFGTRYPFLHGGLSVAARERTIRAFEQAGPSAFILSLKTGGFGLNLTKATHVIHFDRWWNPAVENQATDRAHRIGQTRTVFVHTFITAGTLEERIDEILRRKMTLEELIRDGEAFERAVGLV